MISKVSIENLRGIRSGQLDGLSSVSILVGPNNAGKSTCLEAIAMASLGTDIRAVVDLLWRRGGSALGALRHVVSGEADTTAVDVEGPGTHEWSRFGITKDFGGMFYPQQHLNLESPMLGVTLATSSDRARMFVDSTGKRSEDRQAGERLFRARLVDVATVRSPRALEDAYTEIDRAGRLDEVVKALRASMPGLEDLRILKEEDEFVLHTFLRGGARVPTYLAGDGLKRLLELAAALADVGSGVALLEEPECYQHPRYLRELVTLIHFAALRGTQVILSTHSVELIAALLHADWPAEVGYPTVHRMRLDAGQLKSIVLSREQALVALDELAEDLRA